jgi:hypothetical protein
MPPPGCLTICAQLGFKRPSSAADLFGARIALGGAPNFAHRYLSWIRSPLRLMLIGSVEGWSRVAADEKRLDTRSRAESAFVLPVRESPGTVTDTTTAAVITRISTETTVVKFTRGRENRGVWMTKSAVSLACVTLVATVVSTVNASRAANHQHNDGTGRLVSLASAQFPNLTRAEIALRKHSDVKNVGRAAFAASGPSSNPDDPSNDPRMLRNGARSARFVHRWSAG